MRNEGRVPYQLQWKTTTGFMAVRLWHGRTRIFVADGEGPPFFIHNAPKLTFWSCAGPTQRRKHGSVVSLQCINSGLTQLDVRMLIALEALDCSNNRLRSLDVSSLRLLKQLNVEDNLIRDEP